MINMPGGPELMVIILVALIVLGPEQLPKAMRTFGNVMAEIRKVSSGFQSEIKSAMDSFTDEVDNVAKPHSGQMGDASRDVTEVVARNGSTASSASSAPAPTSAAEEVAERPKVSPADRAAG